MSDLGRSWERLSQVAVKGAEYNSRERQPHPKCLPETRVNFLAHTNKLLDDEEGNRIIWVHGMPGVGKSAIAFNIAERMKGLKVTEERPKEKRLAGTFFFSRKYENRCMTGYFFATLVYQLAKNFPSIKSEVNEAINNNPSLLDPDESLPEQMEALFLEPLRRLRLRLATHPPVVFVVDALDECTSKAEIADLISLLGKALRDPGLPVIRILFTSRSESYIREAMQKDGVWPLVREIPVTIFRDGVTHTISLDGVDVDNDIYIFLQHSFATLQSCYPAFPQPTQCELEQLASRAGRRFIVASTMMKFIDDGSSDPRDRLQLMLKLTSRLLPGTEVFKLYDDIILTCADPLRVYMHLSVVAMLANPLPIAQISELLGPGEGKDFEKAVVQLRSIIDVPADPSLPVGIYHSSVRDYVSDPSHCGLLKGQWIMPAHSLLARASFRLMIGNILESTRLLGALSELNKHSRAVESHDPQSLKESLAFIKESPTPLGILMALVWLRGDRSPQLRSWLDTRDGKAWLYTDYGTSWLSTKGGKDWLGVEGQDWLQTQEAGFWLSHWGGRNWLKTPSGRDWLWTHGLGWLQTHSDRVADVLKLPTVKEWLQSPNGQEWLRLSNAQMWLQSPGGQIWLQSPDGQKWLQSSNGKEWLQSPNGQKWLLSPITLWSGDIMTWLWWSDGREWLRLPNGQKWLQSPDGQKWLQFPDGQEWLQSSNGKEWLQSPNGQECLFSRNGPEWLQSPDRRMWLDTELFLATGNDFEWLQTMGGQEWLRNTGGQEWPRTTGGKEWLLGSDGRKWLEIEGDDWLDTKDGYNWLETKSGKEWLDTENGRARLPWGWLETHHGQEWLQSQGGDQWLRSEHANCWIRDDQGQEWLMTQSGQRWLRTPECEWYSDPIIFLQLNTREFLQTVDAVTEFVIIPHLSSLPTFQTIRQFKSLPDFLMFPAFLALSPQGRTSGLEPEEYPDIEIIRTMKAFTSYTKEAQERSQTASASGALMYACQHWAMHLSRAPNPWDDQLEHLFKVFWDHHLLSWLENQWYSKGLRSCLTVLSEAQTVVAKKFPCIPESSQTDLMQDVIAH